MSDYLFSLESDKPKPAAKEKDLTTGARKLIKILAETAAPEVMVKLRQVTELIGEEKTNELVLFVRNNRKLIRPRISSRSTIPTKKRYTDTELAGFITKDLFDAIKEAQQTKVKYQPTYNGSPDPVKVAAAKEQKGVS